VQRFVICPYVNPDFIRIANLCGTAANPICDCGANVKTSQTLSDNQPAQVDGSAGGQFRLRPDGRASLVFNRDSRGGDHDRQRSIARPELGQPGFLLFDRGHHPVNPSPAGFIWPISRPLVGAQLPQPLFGVFDHLPDRLEVFASCPPHVKRGTDGGQMLGMEQQLGTLGVPRRLLRILAVGRV
jgi:hypothetical protein